MAEEFSFDASVASAAIESLESGAPETPETGTTPEAPATPDLPAGETPAASAPDAKPTTELGDDTLIPVTDANGNTTHMTLKELREGNMRQADYTRKTQEVARTRKEAEQIATAYQKMMAERQQLATFLQDQNALKEYYQQTFGPLTPAPQTNYDPNEIPTVGDVQTLAQQQAAALLAQREAQFKRELQNVAQWTQEQIQAAAQDLEDRQLASKHATEINAHLADIFKEHPVLGAVTNMEDMLRWEVLQAQPQTVAEAKKAFSNAAKAQVEKINAVYAEANKHKAVEKAKLTSNGIEPPGGTGVQPQPKTFKTKDGGIDWKDLQSSAIAYLNANPRK